MMIKHVLLALFALLAWPAQAANYYFCDCQTGAHGSCVAGSNGVAGTSSAAPKQNLSGFNFNDKLAGDQFLFCRGGAWNATMINVDNTNTTVANPMVFDAYTPSWGATAIPWLRNAVDGAHGIRFGGYNNSTDDKGYLFRNLKFDGGDLGQWGTVLWGITSYVTFDNIEFTGWDIGVHLQNPAILHHLTFRNSKINRNGSMGILGAATDLLMEDTQLNENNFSGSDRNHAIYLGSTTPVSRITLRRLQVWDNSTITGVCHGGNVTGHGQLDQVTIEDVDIRIFGSHLPSCYGFSFNPGYPPNNEWNRRFVLRNSRAVNVNIGFGVTFAPDALIENNVFINDDGAASTGFSVPGDARGEVYNLPQDADGRALMRNNTAIFMGTPHADSRGYQFVPLAATAPGTGLRLVNNLTYFASNANTPYCFNLVGTPASFAQIDNNQCNGGAGWMSGYASTAAFETRHASSAHNNFTTAPTFVGTPSVANPQNAALASGSNGRNAGTVTNGTKRDRLACKRDSTPDVGAYEVGGTPCLTVSAPVFPR